MMIWLQRIAPCCNLQWEQCSYTVKSLLNVLSGRNRGDTIKVIYTTSLAWIGSRPTRRSDFCTSLPTFTHLVWEHNLIQSDCLIVCDIPSRESTINGQWLLDVRDLYLRHPCQCSSKNSFLIRRFACSQNRRGVLKRIIECYYWSFQSHFRFLECIWLSTLRIHFILPDRNILGFTVLFSQAQDMQVRVYHLLTFNWWVAV